MKKAVALFDFDGTLIDLESTDRFIQFVFARHHPPRARRVETARLVLKRLHILPGQIHKRVQLQKLQGLSLQQLDEYAAEYADWLLQHHMRSDVVEALRTEQANGVEPWIVSAGFTPYIIPIAKHLGIPAERVLAVDLQHCNGTLTGRIDGVNPYGKKKLNKLEAVLPIDSIAAEASSAYSDSHSDAPLFSIVERTFFITHDAENAGPYSPLIVPYVHAQRITFIAPKAYQLFNPAVESTFGGAEVQLSFLARELAQRDELDVHVVTADYGQPALERFGNVTVHASFAPDAPMVSKVRGLLRTLQLVRGNITIQRTLSPFTWILALLAWVGRGRFVFMVAHDDDVRGMYLSKRTIASRLFSSAAFRLADLVVTQNETQQRALEERGIQSVQLPSSYPLPTGPSSTRSHLLWVSRAERWKRPELFLELAAQLPNERCVMVAPRATTDPTFFDEIQQQAAKIPNVEFIDFVPFDQVDTYFQEATLLVNTSRAEGFPNTFVQATMHGVPVASLSVNPNNVLSTEKIGVFGKDDLLHLTQEVKALLQDTERYTQMSKAAFEYAQHHHNIRTNTKKLLDLLTP